jgi:hypothetical protein
VALPPPRRAALAPLNRSGDGLLVDLGVLRPDAVADGAAGGGGEFEVHGVTPYKFVDV